MPPRRLSLILAFLAGAGLTVIVLNTPWLDELGLLKAQANAALYPERNWRRGKPSKLNISVYAFSDRNRNGRYDLGDTPLARVAVRLTRPDGGTRLARSNKNGYTNFSMQRGGSEADISGEGGTYDFELLPPPGWQVTTGNARQPVKFRSVRGSISGLGAETPPAAVGLAPPSSVSGRWPEHGNATLSAYDGTPAPAREIRLDRKGRFEADLEPGTWELTLPDGTGRRVDLGYAPVYLGRTIAAESAAVPDRERVRVDFEDNRRSFIEKLPAGYAGLAWDYLLAVENQYYKGPGYVNGLTSGRMVAYNSSGHPVTITGRRDGERFDFFGGFFTVAWHNAEGETLIARAWRDETLILEERVTLSHLTPIHLQAEYRDITRLELSTEHYWQFVADDLEFAVTGTSRG